MALTLEQNLNVKERCRADAQKVGVAESLRALWKHMQQLGNPDLKFKSISGLASADVVVSDAACKLYAWCIKKPSASTVDAWAKISDHASTAGTNPDVAVKMVGTGGGGRAYCPIWLDGLPLGTGCTVGCHTANNGNTKSAAADAVTGFAIVGAP